MAVSIASRCLLRLTAIVIAFAQSALLRGQEFELRPLRSFDCSDKAVFALSVDAAQRLVATGGADAEVSLWDLGNSKRLRKWKPSSSSVIDLAFAPREPHVASVSYPKSLTLFDAKRNQQLWQTKCISAPTRVTFSRDGKAIGVGSVVGRAAVFDAASGRLINVMGQELPASGGVTFSADGRYLYVGATPLKNKPGQSRILRCDATSGKIVASLGTHDTIIVRLRLSPSGRRIASLDRGGTLKVWDLANDVSLQSWALKIDNTRCLQFLDDSTLVVSGNGRAAVVRVGEQQELGSLDLPPGGNELASLPKRGLVALAVARKIQLYSFDKERIQAVAPVVVQLDQPKGNAKPMQAFTKQDNQPPQGIDFDGLVSTQELSRLVGQPLALKMKSGLWIPDADLESLQFDRREQGLRFLKYKLDTGRSVTVKSSDIYALRIGRGRYQLRYYRPGQQLFLIDTDKAMTIAANRLAAANHSPRELLEADAQQQATAEHKAFLQDAAKKLENDGVFRIVETESTLILTDFPAAMIQSLRSFVDSLNQELNQIFGVPQGDSIWRGKAILGVFSTKAGLVAFEEKVMNYRNHGGRPGVREGRMRFIQTAIMKQMTPALARGICWGYSLGFAKRLHSDARGYPWLNLGIADSMQYLIMPDPKQQKNQRDRVARQLQADRSLLGLLRATKIEQDRWPTCSQIVQFLIAQDPIAFGQLFRDAKLGVDVEDALKQNFGITLDKLARSFGRSLGVANVTP